MEGMIEVDRWRRWRDLEKNVLNTGVVLVDACVATEIQKICGTKAVDEKVLCARAALDYPKEVRGVHREGLLAGAHVVIANTYATCGTIMNAAGRASETEACTTAAVAEAKAARDAHSPSSLVAGSISCHPPLMPPGAEVAAGTWPSPTEEVAAFQSHAKLLAHTGCDLIVVEMVWDLVHGTHALEAACSVGLPVILSLAIPYSDNSRHASRIYRSAEPLRLGGTSDTPLSEAVAALVKNRPRIVAVCIHHTPIKLIGRALQAVRAGGWTGVLGAYPMSGAFSSPLWNCNSLDPQSFLCAAQSWVSNYGLQMIGAGYGFRAKHLQHLAAHSQVLVDEFQQSKTEQLHRAVSQRRIHVLEQLSDHCDTKSRIGQTALHVASMLGDNEIVAMLLDAGADTTIKDSFNLTAADTAMLCGHTEVRNQLMSRSQGSRKVCVVYLESLKEQLGLNLKHIEKKDEVRITGVTAGGAGDRCGVVTGRIMLMDGNPVRNLSEVVNILNMIKKLKRHSFSLVIQTDPQYEAGAVVEVLKDLIVSNKVAVKQGARAVVQGQKRDADGGRRVVLTGMERLDDRTGLLGAMPWEIAHVSAGDVNVSVSVDLTGTYYDTWLLEQIHVAMRNGGGGFVVKAESRWGNAVISTKGPLVTIRGNGEGMNGNWNGAAINWDDGSSWVRECVSKRPAKTEVKGKSKPDMVKMGLARIGSLLRKGFEDSKPNSQPSSRNSSAPATPNDKAKGSGFDTPVDDEQLLQAAAVGDADLVLQLLSQGVNIDKTDSNGETALHIAARNGSAEVAEVLLTHGANTTIKSSEGRCATDVAALNGRAGLRLRLREAAQGPRVVYSMSLQTATEKLGLDLKYVEGQKRVNVTGVVDGTAAAAAGVEPGTLLAIEGQNITSLADVVRVVNPLKGTGKVFDITVQLAVPPLCPNKHKMSRAKGIPDDIKAYAAEGDLVLTCDICDEEDLQERDYYYHCTQCEHDVCKECSKVAEFIKGKTVDIVSNLVCSHVTAVPAGMQGKVVGVHVDSVGQRRIIIDAKRVDGRGGAIGALPHEVMLTVDDDEEEEVLPVQWKVVWSPGVFVRSKPAVHATQLGWKTCGDIVTAVDQQGNWIRIEADEGDEHWMLVEGSEVGLGTLLVQHDPEGTDTESTAPTSLSQSMTEFSRCDTVPKRRHSFGGLWTGKADQEVYRERWKAHWMKYSASGIDGVFKPPVLEDTTRVWVTSDIHVDHKANMQWLETFPERDGDGVAYREGTLIVAGDVCTKLESIRQAFVMLKKVFQHVMYCVGNHELWQWGKDVPDSVEKFFEIMDLADEVGVQTVPCVVSGVVICPLQSWYQANFSEATGGKLDKMIEVFDGGCKWPACVGDPHVERNSLTDSIGEFFLSLNAPLLDRWGEEGYQVISFSHFIPRPDLFPGHKRLDRVMGTRALETIIRLIGSSVHCFGHSHLDIDVVEDGCRYVQNNLGYPRDRGGPKMPLMVWDSS
eukprot:TRINITY_DN3562_c0_g1_i1.p1 TRINITY_DN3562_c0_g1~~TRINITY_DN3562_c0_g1_i1.p1  ORF type:complete len:1494 (+),score=451.06 TRINITY_DN3562_c0_g1_i1:64-4482(+)